MRLALLLLFALNVSFGLGQSTDAYRLCFAINSSELAEVHDRDIELISQQIQRADFSYMKIVGYATTAGSETYNKLLSERRAYEVFHRINALHPIDDTRFFITWIGEDAELHDLYYEHAQPQTPCVEILVSFR
ncbi:MAG: OmpA family protein [Cryomorphaceae bacterium]